MTWVTKRDLQQDPVKIFALLYLSQDIHDMDHTISYLIDRYVRLSVRWNTPRTL